jgi:type IV pilus assembly protein PilO
MSNGRANRGLVRGILIGLLVIDLVAAAVLLSPAAGLSTARFLEADRVRQQWKEEQKKAAPIKDIDKKIADARTQVAEFERTRLPARQSAVAVELGKVVTENGVHFSNMHYKTDEDAIAGLRRLQIDASLSGDYLKVVKFINALERDKMFFLVTNMGLGEQQSGTVRLELKIETYLRESESAPAPAATSGESPTGASATRPGKHV